MNLQEITDAVDAGKTVYGCHTGYRVIRDKANALLYVHCQHTGSITPLTYGGRLVFPEGQFFLAPEPEQPVRCVWLLDLRTTCLVDAVDEAGARKAWKDGLEYEYEIDTEGGILHIERYAERFARAEGLPGDALLSFTRDELDQLLYCLEQMSVDYSERDPREASEDQRAYDSALRKVVTALPSSQAFAGEGEMKDFSSSMLGN
jgi:hypothetical protein